MASLLLENLDDDLVHRLQIFAAQHNQSVEAEVTGILTAAIAAQSDRRAWVAKARRIAALGPTQSAGPDVLTLLREERDR